MTRSTPLIEEHRRLGAKLVPFAGWSMPLQYSGIVDEHHAVRQHAGLFDASHMGELEIHGPGAETCVDELVTSRISPVVQDTENEKIRPGLPVGKGRYTVACNTQGGILDDLLVYRLAQERFLVVCNASNHEKIQAHLTQHVAQYSNATLTDRSDELSLIALQGPAASSILSRITPAAPTTPFHIQQAPDLGEETLVARTGYTGEDGFEIFCRNTDAVPLWQKIMQAGKELGIQPAGLGARDTLRLEARLSLYGNELTEQTNPLEAGLGWVVHLHKPAFVGLDALRKIKASMTQPSQSTRTLVGFEMTDRNIARHGHVVVNAQGLEVGEITSGAPSPTLGRAIGLAYVPSEWKEVGTAFQIKIRHKVGTARVCATPFYKRPATLGTP